MRPRSWRNCASPKRSSMLDDHDARLRHVDADLDHRGRHKNAGVALGEAPHGAVFLGAAHAAVNEFDNAAKPLRQIAAPVLSGGDVDHFGLFDQRTNPVDAAAGVERALTASITSGSRSSGSVRVSIF